MISIDNYLAKLDMKYPNFDELNKHILKVFNGINEDFEKSQTIENRAGVLVNLVLSAEIIKNKLPPIRNIFLIFERRAENLSKHPGQISFPGGLISEIDNGSIVNTAIREANEELGINEKKLIIISEMKKYFSSSNIQVVPIICWMIEDVEKDNVYDNIKTQYYPRTPESEETIVIPLTHLLDPKNYMRKNIVDRNNKVRITNVFKIEQFVKNKELWGLSAAITKNFIDLVFDDNLLS